MNKAIFAVVGHPNKGKSSIVSTLTRNDEIKISPCSGTTKHANTTIVQTTHTSYILVDTPGFQRPRKVLAWLNQQTSSADLRASAVAKFVNDPDCQTQFPDEVELLTPLVNGAAILYVVDGSRPYSIEYEVEMEILRWTGQASMALINPIENHDYIDSWSNALSQYFKTVRVFDPMKANFDNQLELLQTFAYLKPSWSDTINLVIQDLRQNRKNQQKNSAIILARSLEDMCFYQSKQKVFNKQQTKTTQTLLEKKFTSWISHREQKSIQELFANYSHYQTNLSIEDLKLPPDLFEYEQWYMWGLNKQQLMTAGAITGATAGATVDLAVAGHSFMLGAISGGLIGAGSAWLSANKLVETKLKGLPLGGFEACYGPIKNKNFPYVVIGRFLYLYEQIHQRNHARRGTIEVTLIDLQQQITKLEKLAQKKFHAACDKLTKQKPIDNLEKLLIPLFEHIH